LVCGGDETPGIARKARERPTNARVLSIDAGLAAVTGIAIELPKLAVFTRKHRCIGKPCSRLASELKLRRDVDTHFVIAQKAIPNCIRRDHHKAVRLPHYKILNRDF
tara:strand:- start:118 stop:438 length:321 start_codon:yes stop_codon:yes gene_type:complete